MKCVDGKFDILYKLSASASENPTGVIQDIIYPQVGQETLKNLANELYFKGKWYQTQVHMKMHSLYSHASRKMLLALLEALPFQTNLNASKPLIEAINIKKTYRDFQHEFYPDDVNIPIKNVIPNEWVDMVVVNSENGIRKINRVHYELSVFQELKKQLNCKMIWIEDASLFCNPKDAA